jgi:hypothetical protein
MRSARVVTETGKVVRERSEIPETSFARCAASSAPADLLPRCYEMDIAGAKR